LAIDISYDMPGRYMQGSESDMWSTMQEKYIDRPVVERLDQDQHAKVEHKQKESSEPN